MKRDIDIKEFPIGEEIYWRFNIGTDITVINAEEAKELLDLTENMSAKTKFEQSVSCIGVPTCQIGLCNSQGTLNAVMDYFKANNGNVDVLPSVHF